MNRFTKFTFHAAIGFAIGIMIATTATANDNGLEFNNNAYGLGVDSDQYGRAYRKQDPLTRVERRYGGVLTDQYGRPLEIESRSGRGVIKPKNSLDSAFEEQRCRKLNEHQCRILKQYPLGGN